MQDEQTVTFQPTYVDGSPYWIEKLFALFLLAILVVLLVRAIRCTYFLLKIRSIEKSQTNAFELMREQWQQCWWNAHSLTKFAVLTFFLSFFTLSMSLVDAFMGLATEKQFNSLFVFGRLSEKLTTFNAGLVVCILLYATGFYFESRLNRRKMKFEAGHSAAELKVDSMRE
jgi:hypothetical protein